MKRTGQIIFLIIIVAALSIRFVRVNRLSGLVLAEGESIIGSGTIEAETLIIASEIEGRIVEISVDEGAEVSAGDALLELDNSLLLAQRAELEAAISTAKSNLAAVAAGPRPEEIAAAEAGLSQAETLRDGAYGVWQNALLMVEEPQPLLVPLDQIQAQVEQLEKAVELAQAVAKTAAINAEAASRNQSSHAALVGQEIAQKQLQAANVGLELAEAQLAAAKIQRAHLWEMYTNPIPFQAQANQAEAGYRLAQAAVNVAEANLAAARAEAQPEAVAVAEVQVKQAESALALFEVQQRKYTLTAPRNGRITKQVVNPGEIAIPGATLLTLADLDYVTLKVFIPETQIGLVKVGQPALVTIDSVDDVFEGSVTYIASEAEFTPKNVQTQEERVNLVFAVEIGLDNPNHILKPGMPADAQILLGPFDN